MARPAPALARRAPARANPPGRARTAPPRRVSGPRRRRAATPRSGKLSVRLWRAPFSRLARARTADVLDALLYGRAWIGLVGVLLVGIVFFNVDLLQLNRNIAETSQRASQMKRENGQLRLQLARLGSSERIQEAAANRGLVLPAPGEVRYLRSNPAIDSRRAAKRITQPNAETTPSPTPQSAPQSGAVGGATPPAGAQAQPPAQTPPQTGAQPQAGTGIQPQTTAPGTQAPPQTTGAPAG
jgi:cell division protein FtsL